MATTKTIQITVPVASENPIPAGWSAEQNIAALGHGVLVVQELHQRLDRSDETTRAVREAEAKTRDMVRDLTKSLVQNIGVQRTDSLQEEMRAQIRSSEVEKQTIVQNATNQRNRADKMHREAMDAVTEELSRLRESNKELQSTADRNAREQSEAEVALLKSDLEKERKVSTGLVGELATLRSTNSALKTDLSNATARQKEDIDKETTKLREKLEKKHDADKEHAYDLGKKQQSTDAIAEIERLKSEVSLATQRVASTERELCAQRQAMQQERERTAEERKQTRDSYEVRLNEQRGVEHSLRSEISEKTEQLKLLSNSNKKGEIQEGHVRHALKTVFPAVVNTRDGNYRTVHHDMLCSDRPMCEGVLEADGKPILRARGDAVRCSVEWKGYTGTVPVDELKKFEDVMDKMKATGRADCFVFAATSSITSQGTRCHFSVDTDRASGRRFVVVRLGASDLTENELLFAVVTAMEAQKSIEAVTSNVTEARQTAAMSHVATCCHNVLFRMQESQKIISELGKALHEMQRNVARVRKNQIESIVEQFRVLNHHKLLSSDHTICPPTLRDAMETLTNVAFTKSALFETRDDFTVARGAYRKFQLNTEAGADKVGNGGGGGGGSDDGGAVLGDGDAGAQHAEACVAQQPPQQPPQQQQPKQPSAFSELMSARSRAPPTASSGKASKSQKLM